MISPKISVINEIVPRIVPITKKIKVVYNDFKAKGFKPSTGELGFRSALCERFSLSHFLQITQKTICGNKQTFATAQQTETFQIEVHSE